MAGGGGWRRGRSWERRYVDEILKNVLNFHDSTVSKMMAYLAFWRENVGLTVKYWKVEWKLFSQYFKRVSILAARNESTRDFVKCCRILISKVLLALAIAMCHGKLWFKLWVPSKWSDWSDQKRGFTSHKQLNVNNELSNFCTSIKRRSRENRKNQYWKYVVSIECDLFNQTVF